MTRHVTKIVDFIGGTGYRAVCADCPDWIARGRELASRAIDDAKTHEEEMQKLQDAEKHSKCFARGCTHKVRMSISTNRSSNRSRVYSTVDYDDRTAPRKGVRYCKRHGLECISAMIDALVDEDEETDGTDAGGSGKSDANGIDPAPRPSSQAQAAPA